MFALPTLTIMLVGGAVLLAVIVLLFWGITFREDA
jgi:hypothetical protein